jgi:hypothetical protein
MLRGGSVLKSYPIALGRHSKGRRRAAATGARLKGVYVIDIAVGNIAIEEIWNTVEDGTPIEIRP